MTTRINGRAFTLDLGFGVLEVKSFKLAITDNRAVAMRDGRPDGTLEGDVTGTGSIVVYKSGMDSMSDQAKSAGSWQDMPTFDINSYGSNADEGEFKVEAFGCKMKLESLLEYDKTSSDETTFEIPFDITSPDFVSINGVPYLSQIKK